MYSESPQIGIRVRVRLRFERRLRQRIIMRTVLAFRRKETCLVGGFDPDRLH